jgi:hypothetical protein
MPSIDSLFIIFVYITLISIMISSTVLIADTVSLLVIRRPFGHGWAFGPLILAGYCEWVMYWAERMPQ